MAKYRPPTTIVKVVYDQGRRVGRRGGHRRYGLRSNEQYWELDDREIVGFRLALLADLSGLRRALVHVVRDGAHVVKELRVDRPLLVFAPDGFADEGAPAFGHGLPEGEAVLTNDDIA